ncbi:hypothetical protein ADK52_12035 [Streptomyces sp. WM6372]|nr:hypothetical protein ADK52_12035 [Streptomyces sp. WM6372]
MSSWRGWQSRRTLTLCLVNGLCVGWAWANHQRVHQYTGDITESWGGKRISIDQDFLDVQLGTPVVSKSARAGAYRPSGPTLER